MKYDILELEHRESNQRESIMNKINIEINTDNAAFHDDEDNHAPASELARILRTLADDIDSSEVDPNEESRALIDINGNRVGAIFMN